MNLWKANKGFTLVEILIVMALLSILVVSSTVAAPLYIKMANDARRKDDLHRIKINLEIYFDYAQTYPQSLPTCDNPLMYKDLVIMKSVPCDPTTKIPYFYQVKDDDYQAYRLYAKLVNKNDISIVNVGCSGGCGPDCEYNYGVSSANTSLTKCSFVCAPGGGKLGSCERYENTEISLCPKLFLEDSTCNMSCNIAANKCKNASGKHVPNKF